MNQQQVDEVIHRELLKATNGASVENPKLDFKRSWYKLDDADGIGEFLCDTSAIANTVGLDGFIVIGYDEKNNKFYPAPFSSTGLADNSQMSNLIAKHVEPLYTVNVFAVEFQGNYLSVLHIPPSLNKPHVIRSYKKKGKDDEQRIYVRKNSVNHKANRYDIEMMYYDRKNIFPEFEVKGSFDKYQFQILKEALFTEVQYKMKVPLVLENTGRRPLSIIRLVITFEVEDIISGDESFSSNYIIGPHPLIIKPNEMAVVDFEFFAHSPKQVEGGQELLVNQIGITSDIAATSATAVLTTGKHIGFEISIGS